MFENMQFTNRCKNELKSKNWICFGSTTFINISKDKAVKMIEDDIKGTEERIESAREELKNRVDELRKMEHAKDLEELGFKLQSIV
ncbi:unnamed protein product [Gongylonema pulchrum]|uniref:P53 and DNA damage-regulated protein 1 n=1 Tax=Gongylonema pulchrum TaxID=637853 RepID=A0A183F0N4_9BILA|nr:unnamed protein product [Gongylonema pulchrum]